MPLELGPSGSLFVVFKNRQQDKTVISVLRNNKELISTRPVTIPKENLLRTAFNDFSISVWVKPDTNADHPKGMIIFPCEGEKIYGEGHTSCGLAAGLNAVRVFERDKGASRGARNMITAAVQLQGWTHLVVRYQNGNPSLFINGKKEMEVPGSGKIVHPGLFTAPTDEFFSAAFEGNSTRPLLFTKVLADENIFRLFKKGLPVTDPPSAIALARSGGKLRAMVRENGNYLLKTEQGVKEFTVNNCRQTLIHGKWKLSFPAGSGAPSFVLLEKPGSLHKHPDFHIKHFSGTVIYSTNFIFSKKGLESNQKIFLDLGRVEVVASVRLNGKPAGNLWKEPFITEITTSIKEGNNQLEVEVTTLWPNRLIGDAHLPQENEYDENGIIRQLPGWFLQNQLKPGQRKSFSVWNDFKQTDPLLEAGLLGPVRLLVAEERTFDGIK
jgi:hypothetical protein